MDRVFGRLRAAVRAWRRPLDSELRVLQEEVRELRREMQSRTAAVQPSAWPHGACLGRGGIDGAPAVRAARFPWTGASTNRRRGNAIGDDEPCPDPEGREWLTLDACPVCGGTERTLVNPWNKFILIPKAPDQTSARYDYAVCHCLRRALRDAPADRQPVSLPARALRRGRRQARLARHRRDHQSSPQPVSAQRRGSRRAARLAAHGVFVSDHLGLTGKQYLAPLLRDRFENSVHTDIIGSLIEPRGARVVEVRSRAGTILDGLRRAWGAHGVRDADLGEPAVPAARAVRHHDVDRLIDFEHFAIPVRGRVRPDRLQSHVHARAASARLLRRAAAEAEAGRPRLLLSWSLMMPSSWPGTSRCSRR